MEKDGYKRIVLDGGTEINTRTVVITTGVDYRKLETKGIEDFTGAGIYYGAAMTEAASCKDKEVYIVGGGNSGRPGSDVFIQICTSCIHRYSQARPFLLYVILSD